MIESGLSTNAFTPFTLPIDNPPCDRCHSTLCLRGAALLDGQRWCDPDIISTIGNYPSLGFEEQIQIFAASYLDHHFERTPTDWHLIWLDLWDSFTDKERYPNVQQEFCPTSKEFTFTCFCDIPPWDFTAQYLPYLSPSQAYGFFSALLKDFSQHTQCSLDPLTQRYVDNLTPKDFYLGFHSHSCAYPLAMRWACYKAYALTLPRPSPMFDYMYSKVNHLESQVRSHYFALATPEGAAEDMVHFSMDLLRTMVDFCSSVGEDTATLIGSVLRAIVARAVALPHELFTNFREWLANSVIEGFKEKAKYGLETFTAFILHPLTMLLFKTTVRWWMGFTVKSMLLEVMWDKDLGSYLPQVVTLITDATEGVKAAASHAASFAYYASMPDPTLAAQRVTKSFVDKEFDPHFAERLLGTPEAADSAGMLVLVLGLAIGSLGTLGPLFSKIDFSFVSKLCRDIYTSASLLDKLGAKDSIASLIRYMRGVSLDDEERARFSTLYPNTIAFVDAHVDYVARESPNNADKAVLKHHYSTFLRERVKWNMKDAQRLGQLSQLAVHCATQLGATAHFEFRREPSMFLFMGPPGTGKTSLVEAALNTIAQKEDPNRNLADAIYTVCIADQYCSGYVNQELWKFDDMFQKVDTTGNPSGDIDLMFQLSTTAPFTLNMASLEDKGKIARCYLAAASTNINFFSDDGVPSQGIPARFGKHIASIKNPDALRRRLTYCVYPIVQPPFAYDSLSCKIVGPDGAAIKDKSIDRSVLYKFRIMGTDNILIPSPRHDSECHDFDWSWPELLRFMWKEYALTRDYLPGTDVSLQQDLRHLDDENNDAAGIAEGWYENICATVTVASFATLGYLHGANTRADLVCPCGKVQFTTDTKACVQFEYRMRKRHNIKEPMGQWIDVANFSPSGVTYNSVYADVVQTKYPRFTMTPYEGPLPVDVDEVDNWEALLDAGTRSFQLQRGIRVRLTQPVGRHFSNFAPGLYIMGSCYSASRIVPHLSAMAPGAALLYSSTGFLLFPLIGALIGAGLSRLALWRTKTTEEDDHVIVRDGEPLFLNPDTLAYEPQAPLSTRARVFKNGKWYYKVKKSNGGYEWYPQSPEDNLFVKLISKSQRLEAQCPVLRKSIWAVVNEDGVLQGNVFAIDAKRVLTPLHVARLLESTVGLVLVRDEEKRKIVPNYGSGNALEKNVVVTPIGPDAAIVEFFVTKMPEILTHCRDHVGKFVHTAPTSGNCMLMRRNAKGAIEICEGPFVSTTNTGLAYAHNSHHYELPAKSVRLVDVVSESGWCGALYVDTSPTAEFTCLGIHVARGRSDNDFAMMHVVQQRDLLPEPIGIPVGNTWLSGVGEAHSLFVESGIATVGRSVHPPLRSIHGRASRKVKTEFHQLFDCPYELAKIAPELKDDGTLYDPWRVSLRKLGDRVQEPEYGEPGLVEVVHALVGDYAPHFTPKVVPSWAETVAFETGLPSVQKKTSAGDPYYAWGGLKNTAFMKGCEVNILTPEYAEFLEWMDNTLCPVDWKTRPPYAFGQVEAVCNGDNKDEPRLQEKMYKPRLYTVVPMHEFLAQRRYLSDIAVAWGQQNVVFSSALGIAPTDFDVLHSYLLEAGEDCVILALDHEHMDGHVKPRLIRLVSLFMVLLTQSYEKGGRVVDPLFPPLNRRGFMIWRLLQRIAWFVIKVGDTLAEPGAMHPSGSFPTALINAIVQDILTIWVLWKLLDAPLGELVAAIKRIFLGDDSLIAIPRKYADKLDMTQLQSLFRSQGFVVTGSDKGANIEKFSLWNPEGSQWSDYAFLSRRFALIESEDGPSVVGLLDPVKIEKIICFTEPKKMENNFPEQVVAMVQEIALYDRCAYPTARQFVQKMHVALSRIRPHFLEDSLHLLRTGGDVAGIRLGVLRYLKNNVIQCVPQAGEGSDMSGLTEFVSDVVADELAPRDADSEPWRLSGMENFAHVEPDYFSCPYACHEFDWGATSPQLLMQKTVPSMYFDGNTNAQMKLANFAFLRATAVVKVIINGSPYVAGKLLLSCRPLGRQIVDVFEASGDPCVEIDAASGKEAELRLPCILPHNWSLVEQYQKTVVGGRNYFDWGYFNLTVLSSLNEISAGFVHGRVYCWLEDVVLQGPTITNFTITPQAPSPKQKKKLPPKPPSGPSQFLKNGRVNPFTVKMVGSRETESSSVSAAIDKYVAPVVRSVGGIITDIGPAALTIAKFAALAGFSMPTQENNITFTSSYVSSSDSAHVDGVFSGIHLGARQQQKVVLPEGCFDMSCDEMQIAHYASRMALLSYFDWDAASISNDIIYDMPVNPGCTIKSIDGLYHPTPLSFAAQFFRFWRGTIRYRLAIAKTRFHSGSLEICYSMGTSLLNPDSEQRASRCYRKVWNVNEMSSLEFEVPYSSATMWTPVQYFTQFDDNSFESPTVPAFTTGRISIRVLNPLTSAGGVVTDTVEVLVYTAGGKDLEFSLLSTNETHITLPTPIIADPQVGGGVYQNDETDGVEDTVSSPMCPASSLSNVGTVSCVGERIDNFRLITRRMSLYTGAKGNSTGHFARFTWRDVVVVNTAIAKLLQTYAFGTGGFRVEVIPTTGTISAPSWALSAIGGLALGTGAGIVHNPIQMPSMHYSCPYYNVTPYIPSAQFSHGDADSAEALTHGPPMSLAVAADGAISLGFRGAAGDDFTLGWQIGPPPYSLASDYAGTINYEFVQYT